MLSCILLQCFKINTLHRNVKCYIYCFKPLFFNVKLVSYLFETLTFSITFSKDVLFFQPNYYTFLWHSEIFLRICKFERREKFSSSTLFSKQRYYNRGHYLLDLRQQAASKQNLHTYLWVHTYLWAWQCLLFFSPLF